MTKSPSPGVTSDELDALIRRARRGDHDAFETAVTPYQQELHRHCYRMTGSLHDADDILQEALLRAWRGLGTYRGTASFRAWLYRIATNKTIDVLAQAQRRADLSPNGDLETVMQWEGSGDGLEPPWMQPYPGPLEMVESLETISTAFVVAIQRLSPRQRAVLLLRDVLGFEIAEIADQLDSTTDSVNSALRRARTSVAEMASAERLRPPNNVEIEIRDRLVSAWMQADVDLFARLLTNDVRLTMPPIPDYFVGAESILDCLTTVLAPDGRLDLMKLHPMVGNGQPGFGVYGLDDSSGRFERRVVMTLAMTLAMTSDGERSQVSNTRVHGIHAYSIHTDIFDRFGLPVHG